MKKLMPLFVLLMLLSSCVDDIGTKEVTFTRATAIYGDIETLRPATLVEESRTLVNPGKIYITETSLLIGEEDKGHSTS